MYTLQLASKIFDAFELETKAARCRQIVDTMSEALRKKSWVAERGLFADTPEHKTFSQHANVMAVLVGLLPEQSKGIMKKVMTEDGLSRCSYYYRFYLAEALAKARMADQYLETIGPWETMLERGLTTFAEEPDPTRSDCHAWSSSPLYHFLSLIAGIRPSSPGFETVRIAPALGALPEIKAEMPHHLGMITMDLKRGSGDAIKGQVVLPDGLTGTFQWSGKTVILKSGSNKISL
jgi:hypothetical protein